MNFHIFRQNDKLKMQKYFIFTDTETETKKLDKENESLTFKLGSFIFWNKETGELIKKDYFNKSDIWNFIDNQLKVLKEMVFYAHNTDFDFKILDGFNILSQKGFIFASWYVQGTTFILRCERGEGKQKQVLHIWDTMNYVPISLKKIGESINLKKLEINFNDNSTEKLLIYCRRDTEIIYLFIRYLITFLEKYNLSQLKPTSASLSLNIFRHQFYSIKKMPIYIHDCKNAIKLERDSYSGGITDCFKVGKVSETIYKLDINSMYPYIMKNKNFPIKMIFWGSYPKYKTDKLYNIYEKNKNENLIIARVKIFIPEKYAYILQKAKVNNQRKSIFLSGTFETVLTSPELDFVSKYGKILKFKEIAVYHKGVIFKDFVTFFYNKRLIFKEKQNFVYEKFCKLILNSQYGKWGQKQIKYIPVIKDMQQNLIKSFGTIINAETKETYQLIQFGKILYRVIETEENSKDSFVAIASFVTAYSRILLIKYLLLAKRKNIIYCDTDSLFINKQGLENLKKVIDNKKLGFLKIEEISNHVIIYKPKFYLFGKDFKCKGVKKNSEIIKETEKNIVFKMFRWERFKTSLKTENINNQLITEFEKDVSKIYDKGIILENGIIKPFSV